MKIASALLPTLLLILSGASKNEESPIVRLAIDEAGFEWKDAYQVESAHYVLRTDIAEDEGRKMIKEIETLYESFFEQFKDVISEKKIRDKLVVYFYGNVGQFKKAMKKVHPGMEESDGFLNTGDNIVHLFRIETKLKNAIVPDRESLFHECAHQLLNTTLEGYSRSSKRPHFWAVEGIACYFESLDPEQYGSSVGKRHPSRFKVLKQFSREVKKINLSKYLQYNQEQLLAKENNPQANYVTASLLAYFLCTAGDGKYREAFLKYARDVNNGAAGVSSFETITTDFANFEEEFKEFVERILTLQ